VGYREGLVNLDLDRQDGERQDGRRILQRQSGSKALGRLLVLIALLQNRAQLKPSVVVGRIAAYDRRQKTLGALRIVLMRLVDERHSQQRRLVTAASNTTNERHWY